MNIGNPEIHQNPNPKWQSSFSPKKFAINRFSSSSSFGQNQFWGRDRNRKTCWRVMFPIASLVAFPTLNGANLPQ